VTDAAAPPGFYGKLPARGDFVSRRLGHAFIEAWDSWLQRAILASREALGGDWLDCYLTSPIWRFAAAAESCGPQPVAGIVMPSVDAVGRYFPLMLGRELPPSADPCAFAAGAAAWFEALEALALSALADGFRMESLDRPLPAAAVTTATTPAAAPLPPPGRHIALADPAGAAALGGAQGGGAARRTMWWSGGSARIGACLLICPGLPAPDAFASLLDGDWAGRGWAVAGDAAPPLAAAPLADAAAPLAWDREG
jgi:type VI secretion system protein ImpM